MTPPCIQRPRSIGSCTSLFIPNRRSSKRPTRKDDTASANVLPATDVNHAQHVHCTLTHVCQTQQRQRAIPGNRRRWQHPLRLSDDTLSDTETIRPGLTSPIRKSSEDPFFAHATFRGQSISLENVNKIFQRTRIPLICLQNPALDQLSGELRQNKTYITHELMLLPTKECAYSLV